MHVNVVISIIFFFSSYDECRVKISFHNDLRKHQIFCQQINAKAGSKVCTVGFFTSLNFLLPLGGRFFKMLLAKIEIQSDRGNQIKINTWLMLT